jgi:UDP-N-acetylmuramoylalanine--D-glutamate ligase
MVAPTTAVLGFGVTGQSVARHLLREGITPLVLDTRPARDVASEFAQVDVRWDTHQYPAAELAELGVTEAVVSPGLSMTSCLVAGAAAAGVELRSDIDLFFAAVSASTNKADVYAVTGTNGKSTVVTLAEHLLRAQDINARAGGNLGTAALDILAPDVSAYVLELSSFQLERSANPKLRAATLLNVSEDHLDLHPDMQHYVGSKQRIYAAARKAIFNRHDPLTIPRAQIAERASVSFGLDTPPQADDWGVVTQNGRRLIVRGSQTIADLADVNIAGDHNVLNILAACALVEDKLSLDGIAAGLASFRGLAHRFEFVAAVRGVRYINDSKATNLGATQAALAGMPEAATVVLIAGGDAKGVDLSPLASLLRTRVKLLVCIGRDAGHLASVADLAGIAHASAATLPEAVAQANAQTQSGDTVLLSPACASLDMFANYAERGRVFAQAVAALADSDGGAA